MVDYSSDLFAAGTQLGQNGVDAVLVDGAQGSSGNTQLHPTVLGGHPEAALVQVGEETAAGLVVCVRDVVAGLHALAGNLANAGHTHLERSGVAHSPGDGGPAAGSWWTGRTRCGKGIRLHGRRRIAFRDRIRHVPDAASRQLCAGKSLIATGKNRGRSAFSPGWAGSRASRPGKGTLTPVFGLHRRLVALPAAVADVQVQAVEGGEGREDVLQHPPRVLLGREQEVAERQ